MKPKAYTLVLGKEEALAVLMTWINGHTAIFRLVQPLGKFRVGNNIKVNMNTKDASLYYELYKDAA